MGLVQRVVPGDMRAAGHNAHTRPFHLVQIEFPAPVGVLRLSTGPACTHAGQEYLSRYVTVEPFDWDADGAKTTRLTLTGVPDLTEVLVNGGLPTEDVLIYEAYWSHAGVVTTPKLVMRGSCITSDITEESVGLDVSILNAKTERTPNRYVSQAAGFNWLPPVGSQIMWGGELYVFED